MYRTRPSGANWKMREPEDKRPSDVSSSRRGHLFVLSGPSGVGKDAVLSRIRQFGRPYHFTITATTRQRRPGERDGVDYIFLTRETFSHMIERGELLEWAEVHGNLYGVPKSQVLESQERGLDVIMKVDVQGAATIKRMMPDARLIFLAPPDIPTLEKRMRFRNTESESEFRLRLETAHREMKEAHRFDHIVVNHDGGMSVAADAIDRIIRSAHERELYSAGVSAINSRQEKR